MQNRNLYTMKTTLFTFILAVFSIQAKAQINQTDAEGKRDGLWLVYLDAAGDKTKDSTKAVYKRYTWHDHGTNVYPMGSLIETGGKIETTGATAEKGKIVLLNGEYKCYNKKGVLFAIHKFDSGHYVSYTEYHPSGSIRTFFDYTKHCDGQEHSWHMYIYDATGKLTLEQCTKKDAAGNWPKMKG